MGLARSHGGAGRECSGSVAGVSGGEGRGGGFSGGSAGGGSGRGEDAQAKGGGGWWRWASLHCAHPTDVFEELLPVLEIVQDSAAALALQQAYLDTGVVTPNWADDALHVALASVSECAAIASWNLQHIVNLRRISLHNAVSMLHGYRSIEIRSPSEVLEYDDPTR